MKKLLGNVRWILIANIYSSISKFIILIAIAQFLSVTEVGIYSLGLAVTTPIVLLFNMKMKSVIVTDQFVDIFKYRNIRNFTNLLMVSICLIIILFLYPEFLMSLMLIGIAKILDVNSEFFQALPNRKKAFHITSLLVISKYTLITMVFTLTLYITKDLNISLIAYLIVQFVHLGIEKHYFNKFITFVINDEKTTYKLILLSMIPLGVTQMFYSFGASIPKYFIERLDSIEVVGIFSALLYFMTIFNLFMNSVFQTLLPYGKDFYFNQRNLFNKILFIYAPLSMIFISIIMVIPIYIAGHQILNFVYGKEYAEYYYLLYFLLISILFNMLGWLFDSALLLSRKVKLQPFFMFCNVIIVLIIGYILIEEYSIVGATLTVGLYSLLNFVFKFIYYITKLK